MSDLRVADGYPGAICGAYLKQPPHFNATRALYRYAFPVVKLIHALKYQRRLASADFLGHALAALDFPATDDQPPDLIVPVPLAQDRLVQRGFNQALELARRLHLRLAHNAVRRCRNTTPQVSLPWKNRARNIRHAFECSVGLTGQRVLVVDDVTTTGATLNEVARVLKNHGASWVGNLLAARSLRD